jgi:hypothetical protein
MKMTNEMEELELIKNLENWKDFAQKFEEWEVKNRDAIKDVWQKWVRVYGEYSHLKKVFEADKSGKYSIYLEELKQIPLDLENMKEFQTEFEKWKKNHKDSNEIDKTIDDLKFWKTIGL